MSVRVLVTGAKGQLGKTIEELYSDKLNDFDFVFVSKAELDITKKKELRLFFNNNFDYCINCAAYTNVEQAEKTPEIAFKINAEGVKNLAEVCKEANTILIHISTDYVFDGEKSEPYIIEDVPNPINEYGRSKLLGEKYIKEALDRYFIVRASWLYSKNHGKNFYRTILEKAKTEKILHITDEQTGSPTNTVNLSQYIVGLIGDAKNDFGIHHFSDNEVMTWYDFAKIILKENNLSANVNLVRVVNYRTFAKRPKNSVILKKENK